MATPFVLNPMHPFMVNLSPRLGQLRARIDYSSHDLEYLVKLQVYDFKTSTVDKERTNKIKYI